MKLTNYEIYTYSQNLINAFTEKNQYLPAKLNFCILRNNQTLSSLTKEIEEARVNIVYQYGEIQEDGNIKVPEDKIAIANKEIDDLFSIEQEVNILKVDIESFRDLQLSIEQMNAIMFMVEGE